MCDTYEGPNLSSHRLSLVFSLLAARIATAVAAGIVEAQQSTPLAVVSWITLRLASITMVQFPSVARRRCKERRRAWRRRRAWCGLTTSTSSPPSQLSRLRRQKAASIDHLERDLAVAANLWGMLFSTNSSFSTSRCVCCSYFL